MFIFFFLYLTQQDLFIDDVLANLLEKSDDLMNTLKDFKSLQDDHQEEIEFLKAMIPKKKKDINSFNDGSKSIIILILSVGRNIKFSFLVKFLYHKIPDRNILDTSKI